MEHPSPVTAAAYIRVSTEDQIEFSPGSQLKRIQEYAESRKIRLPREYIFVDEGISGRSADNRPAFLQMIRTARQKPRPFEQILVWKFSRFARNRQDSIFYKSMLRRECGVDVISVTEQLSHDPTSILIEALLEAMDEYYSINLAQEVRRGMNEKFSQGGVVSIPPFGYRMGEEGYETDPDTATALQRIFSDFLDGKSPAQIAAELNRQNITTRRGNPFSARTVRYILSNPFYSGYQRRHLTDSKKDASMTIVRGNHEPLVSEELFLDVQNRIRTMKDPRHPKIRTTPSGFMLRGLVRCSNCGATLTCSSRGASLQCCRYARGQCAVSHSISIKKLENAVLQQMARDIPSDLELVFSLPSRRKKSAKKDRGDSPVHTILFERLLVLLKGHTLTKAAKNEILRSFVSEIVFSRKDGTILIRYRS